MKIELDKVSYDGRWVDHGEARLKIRPYPKSMADVILKDGGVVISGGNSFEMFSYCLQDWDGVSDADAKPLKLSPAVKKKIFDFQLGKVDGVSIGDKVLSVIREQIVALEEEEKN